MTNIFYGDDDHYDPEWDTPETRNEWLSRLCSLWLIYNNDNTTTATHDRPYQVPSSAPNAKELNEAYRKLGGRVDPWPEVFTAWRERQYETPVTEPYHRQGEML